MQPRADNFRRRCLLGISLDCSSRRACQIATSATSWHDHHLYVRAARKYEEAFAGTTLEGEQGMDDADNWTWPVRPTGPAEFDEMMVSVNRHLAVHNLKVHQRAVHASRLISIALGYGGVPIFGTRIDRGEPFSPADTLQRVFEWYRENYGERNKVDPSPGAVVMNHHNTYWRLKIPMVRGSIPLIIDRDLSVGNVEGVFRGPAPPRNVLLQVEHLTQAHASRLSDDDLSYIWSEFRQGWDAVSCLTDLRGHELFNQARGDYAQSVETLLDARTLSKARWDTAQCAEKIFKGLLARAGHSFPTSGGKGHDIAHLGVLMKQHFGLELSKGSLTAIHCPPMVRYGEMNVDPNEAWTSHKELLSVLRSISAAGLDQLS